MRPPPGQLLDRLELDRYMSRYQLERIREMLLLWRWLPPSLEDVAYCAAEAGADRREMLAMIDGAGSVGTRAWRGLALRRLVLDNRSLRLALSDRQQLSTRLVGQSTPMARLREQIGALAGTRAVHAWLVANASPAGAGR